MGNKSGYNGGYKGQIGQPDPTPEEIAERCAEIQRERIKEPPQTNGNELERIMSSNAFYLGRRYKIGTH